MTVCLLGSVSRAEQTAEEALAERGLSLLAGTACWINASEMQLRRLEQRAAGLHRRSGTLETDLDRQIEQNRQRWTAAGRGRGAVAPQELGSVGAVRTKIIELIDVRLKLTAAVQQMRRLAAKTETAYRPLRDNPTVTSALRELGEAHRLGPARPYKTYLRRLPQYESAVLTDWTPAYLQGQELRFSGLLDERTRVTFSWNPDQELALIPSSMAELAGLEIAADAKEDVLQVGDRMIRVRRFRLRYLQFGNCLLRNVNAALLPPEAEDLGASLGEAAFTGHKVVVQREQLRMVFHPNR